MALSTDLKICEQYGLAPITRIGVSAASDGSFAQALSAAYRAGGGADYEGYFQAAADAYQVPVDLLKAMAKAESNFDANAVSHCGAQGIMQLMPATARSLGVTDSFDPAQNIMGGAKYLRQMLDSFDGNVSLAVAAYNAGPGAVKKYGGVPPYQETKNYVAKVLGYAGSGVSAPAAPADASESGDAFASNHSLTQEELEELFSQVERFSSAYTQESARLLAERLLLHDVNLDEEEEQAVRL